jgi:integrase
VLADRELQLVWEAAGKLAERDPAERGFIRMLMLTGLRRNEAAYMEWREINGDWLVIPATRMKQAKEHRCFLMASAMKIIDAQPRYEAIDGDDRRVMFPQVYQPMRRLDRRQTPDTRKSAGIAVAHASDGASYRVNLPVIERRQRNQHASADAAPSVCMVREPQRA